MTTTTETPVERWRPVPGYEGLYEVSDMGQVRSLRRNLIMVQTLAGSSGKRYRVTLRRDQESSYCYVHTLVLEAFVGPRPPGLVACHLNDDLDNRLSNLRWDTYSANQFDQVRNGRHANASKTHCRPYGHELTDENVYRMRSGGRRCRACKRIDDAARRARAC